MEMECPIDAERSNETSALLKPPSPPQVENYLNHLIKTRECHGLTIQHNGDLGKGLYAVSQFKQDGLLLKDQMLVGLQHSSNKIECLVCSFCFCFVGSVELQIGRRLYLQELGVSSGCCQELGASDDEDEALEQCGSSSSGYKKKKLPLPKGIAQSLMNGELKLPYSDKFPMPPAIPCPGGCGEAFYCSKICAESDWNSSHSLLCTGERSESVSREALVKFIQHANETNDIFLLAAKVVASTILKFRQLKVTRSEGDNKPIVSGSPYLSLLLEAWKPISVGHKRRWWDCVALPFDVESSDEAAFRMQIRELAFTSLQLLKAAIFDAECTPLFSLEVYGHIIGMFELNNLDLVVASPVEDYFLYIDDLPDPIKKEAEEITRPFFEALGDDYSVCCQGTAFYPLQSCMNHSCTPNAKAFKREQDIDGQATIIAVKSISKGDEVTISYVDEDIPFEERQALLADYGFRCRCPRCLEEEP